jgi:hypothetical protein
MVGRVPATRAQVAWSPELAAKVEMVFDRMDKPTSPGCPLAVIRDPSGRMSGFAWDGSPVRNFRFTKDRVGA